MFVLTTSPAFFIASGRASNPVPMFPFSTWMAVWRLLYRNVCRCEQVNLKHHGKFLDNTLITWQLVVLVNHTLLSYISTTFDALEHIIGYKSTWRRKRVSNTPMLLQWMCMECHTPGMPITQRPCSICVTEYSHHRASTWQLLAFQACDFLYSLWSIGMFNIIISFAYYYVLQLTSTRDLEHSRWEWRSRQSTCLTEIASYVRSSKTRPRWL